MEFPEHTPLLQARNLTKSFGGPNVLKGVDFEIRAGEIQILAGENGAGKSTLIKILAGIHAPDSGEIRLLGSDRPVTFSSPRDARNQGVSVIHQELSLIGPMSVLDNMYLGREEQKDPARARHFLDSLNCESIALHSPVENLPLSTQGMLEIAKALIGDSRILILDEPTSALNRKDTEKLFEQLLALKQKGIGIVYISHRMEEIYRLGDRITVLRDGAWVGTEKASDLPESKFIAWMIGREISEHYPKRAPNTRPTPTKPRLQIRGPVNLQIFPGEILGLSGLQGSGIPELLRSIFGAAPHTALQIEIDGVPLQNPSPSHAIRSGMAFLSGDRKTEGLVGSFSVRQNLTLPALPKFSPKAWIRPALESKITEAAILRFRIRCENQKQEIFSLSGGNQQKVLLAKWLETNPRVLILEEPTRGVDIGAKEEIYKWIFELADSGIAILLASTDLPELVALSDRIQVLHRGQMTAEIQSRGRTSAERAALQPQILRAALGEVAS